MATLDLSIDSLFKKSFGSRGGRFNIGESNSRNLSTSEIEFPNVPVSQEDEGSEFVTVRNALGSNLPDGRALFMPVKIGEVLLPNEPTVRFSSRKKIVETVLTGSKRKGTIKEQIMYEGYQIVIRGIALNFDSVNVYPEDIVRGINDLFNIDGSLQIESALTNLFGIYRIVIKEINFPEMIGVQHAQAYELVCISDEDFILEIE